GQDRRTDDRDTPFPRPCRHLGVGGDHLVDQLSVGLGRGGRVAGQDAEIVHAFQDDEVFHAGLAQHIPLEPGHGVGAQTIAQYPVAADALVENRQARRARITLQPFGQHIGPARVAVGRDAIAVGDGVAQDDDGAGPGGPSTSTPDSRYHRVNVCSPLSRAAPTWSPGAMRLVARAPGWAVSRGGASATCRLIARWDRAQALNATGSETKIAPAGMTASVRPEKV